MSLINDEQKLVSARHRFTSSIKDHEFTSEIKTYDDGYGNLYIMRDSGGIMGIVRARTWEDAWSICENEFFPEAEETVEELIKMYGVRIEHVKIIHPAYEKAVYTNEEGKYWIDYSKEKVAELSDYIHNGSLLHDQFVRWETIETPDPESWMDHPNFQEAFGFRPNGKNATDKIGHGIYAKDLNGESLEVLTEQMIQDFDITLQIEEK
jgi:hypothetical protein